MKLKCFSMKKRLIAYIEEMLHELKNVDDYEPEKSALYNLLWFTNHASSDDVITAKLKIMIDSDKKRKFYLAMNNVVDNDYEFAKAESMIGKKCLKHLKRSTSK